MEPDRLPPAVGVAASVAVLALVVAPYLVVSTSGMSVYYDGPLGGPVVVGLFASVTVIAFAAGYANRSPPETVAGATLALGLVMVVLGSLWAFTVPAESIGGFSSNALLTYHRWAFLAATLVVPASAAWYANETL